MCACTRVRACVRACVRSRVRTFTCVYECVRLCVSSPVPWASFSFVTLFKRPLSFFLHSNRCLMSWCFKTQQKEGRKCLRCTDSASLSAICLEVWCYLSMSVAIDTVSMFMPPLNVSSPSSVCLKFKRHTRVTITSCDYLATIYKKKLAVLVASTRKYIIAITGKLSEIFNGCRLYPLNNANICVHVSLVEVYIGACERVCDATCSGAFSHLYSWFLLHQYMFPKLSR